MESLVGGGNEFRFSNGWVSVTNSPSSVLHQVEIINEHVLSYTPLTGYGRIFRHLFRVPVLNKALIATVRPSACLSGPASRPKCEYVWILYGFLDAMSAQWLYFRFGQLGFLCYRL